MIRVAIHGAAGRMGRRLMALTIEDSQLKLAGALEHPGQSLLGQDAGVIAGTQPIALALSDRWPAELDVVIDFSLPAATRNVLSICTSRKLPLIIGTTGLTTQDHDLIDQAAKSIAVLQAPNMSLGVNLLFALAAQAAHKLGDDYDIEISETHHRFKKDAPSGTALGIAKAICDATGKDIQKDLDHGRHGDETQRKTGRIGMHALRMGDVVGDHTVNFATLGERLEISHVATNRDIFVRGALRAAKWIIGKPAGRYHMKDVLGL